jgi:hypothetical protein
MFAARPLQPAPIRRFKSTEVGPTIEKRSDTVSMTDTFTTYNPVTLIMGCYWVLAGFWVAFELITRPARTFAGAIFVIVMFVLLPVGLGAAIIHKQLRLRRKSN